MTLGDEDLSPDQVDTGDHFGDGVFHLDAGVHLDKVVLARGLIHQELHSTGVHIAYLPGNLDSVRAQTGLRQSASGTDQAGAYSTTF